MVLSSQSLREIIFGKEPMINAKDPILEDQIQPASLDCRLGDCVYLMKAAGLPSSGESIEGKYITRCAYKSFNLSEEKSFILLPNTPHLIPLQEELHLSPSYYAVFSPKSSIGRCDIFARVITDRNTNYDRTVRGYKGKLYLEVISFSFPVVITAGLSLVQMRVMENDSIVSSAELEHLHARSGILYDKRKNVLKWDNFQTRDGRLFFHIDLSREVVGFEAMNTSMELLDLSKKNTHDPEEFWRPLVHSKDNQLMLRGNGFYLLATKEYVKIPQEFCAEVVAYDVNFGEFRTHYAGFFDNGFGGECGTAAVLEVRPMGANVSFFDGQTICSMVFQKTDKIPDKIYGVGTGSHYTNRGPSLSKFFMHRQEAWK